MQPQLCSLLQIHFFATILSLSSALSSFNLICFLFFFCLHPIMSNLLTQLYTNPALETSQQRSREVECNWAEFQFFRQKIWIVMQIGFIFIFNTCTKLHRFLLSSHGVLKRRLKKKNKNKIKDSLEANGVWSNYMFVNCHLVAVKVVVIILKCLLKLWSILH